MSRRPFFILVLAVLVSSFASETRAQRTTRRPSRPNAGDTGTKGLKKNSTKTTVTVEILTGSDGLGLGGQTLRPLFENLGYGVRIRQGTSQDHVETREKLYGRLRDVIVVGRLDEKGRLVFADRTFSTSDTKKLGEWLRELETYGAQGAPEGKPLWGMTNEQFKDIHNALSQKVEKDVRGQSFETALSDLALPPQFPVRISTEASAWLKQTFSVVPPVKHLLKDCAKGTALAIVTNEYGMGFRPLRTPEGNVELVVEPLTKTTDVWPIGWAPKQPENEIVPKLYGLDPVEFNKQKLTEALDSISRETGIPVRVDHFGIKTQGIELEALLANHKRSKTPLSLVLTRITVPQRLKSEIRIDEAGQPFIWISFLVPGEAAR